MWIRHSSPPSVDRKAITGASNDDAKALIYMLLAALTFSLFPLVNLLGIRAVDPLLLSLIDLLVSGGFFGLLILLSEKASGLFLMMLKDATVLFLLLLCGALFVLSLYLFSKSLLLIGPGLATILFETHIILLIFVSPIFIRRLSFPAGKLPYIAALICAAIIFAIGGADAMANPQAQPDPDALPMGFGLALASSLVLTGSVLLRQAASERIRSLCPEASNTDIANALSRAAPLAIALVLWADLPRRACGLRCAHQRLRHCKFDRDGGDQLHHNGPRPGLVEPESPETNGTDCPVHPGGHDRVIAGH